VDGTKLTVLQGVPTYGARDMHFVQVNGNPFIIVANFDGDSVMYRWLGPRSISYIDVLDGGQGYVDGDVRLVCSKGPRGNACRENPPANTHFFLAKMKVDGTPDGGAKRGTIKSVEVMRTFKSMTDVDVGMFYPGTRTLMEQTVTSIWPSSLGRVSCVRNITKIQIVSGSTKGCTQETMFASSDSSSFQARVLKVDATSGQISELVLTRPGMTSEALLQPDNAECKCVHGHWRHCLNLMPSPGRLKFQETVGGFEAKAEFDHGSINDIDIVFHGSGYHDTEIFLERIVVESTAVNSSVSCLDHSSPVQARLPWANCIGISIPRGGRRCVGGNKDGIICLDNDDCQNVLDSSRCLEPRSHPRSSARLTISPLLDPPRRTHSRLLQEQPAWEEAPGISSISPTVHLNLAK